MSVELTTSSALSAPQPVSSSQEETPRKVEQKSETDSKISSISQKEIERKKHFEETAKMLAENPDHTILGVLSAQLELTAVFPTSAPKGKDSPSQNNSRSTRTWALISLKTLQGVFARKSELEEVGLEEIGFVCPESSVTPDNFLSILNSFQHATRPAKREKFKDAPESAYPSTGSLSVGQIFVEWMMKCTKRIQDLKVEAAALEKSSKFCTELWTEEEHKAFGKVFGTAHIHFFQQLTQLPPVIDALQKEKISLPPFTEENSFKICQVAYDIIRQTLEKTPEDRDTLNSHIETLAIECDQAVHTEEADELYEIVEKNREKELENMTQEILRGRGFIRL